MRTAKTTRLACVLLLGATAATATAAANPAPPAVAAAAQPVPNASTAYSAADEAIYLQRFAATRGATFAADAYDPVERVPGARRWRPLPLATPRERTISADALAAARDYAGRMNSNALLVWRAGRLEASEWFRGHDAERPVVSRSLSKPMTAVAIGRAIALGRIRSLDQPVADFVTEWRDDPRRSRILVRHLLDMRSGFLAQGLAPTPEDVLNRAYLHPWHERVIIADYPVIDEPGSRFEYNNATSELVAVVIERATGRRYAEFVSSEILRPLGAPGGDVWVNRPGGVAHSGCCMRVPAETWLRLGILLLQDGRWQGRRLLPRGYVGEMRTGTPQNPYYGLGVYVAGPYTERRGFAHPDRQPVATRVLHSEPYLARDLFLFDGNANQVVYVIPSARMVILRTGDAPPRGAGEEWDNSRLPNLLLRGIVRTRGERAPEPQPR